MAKNDDNLDFRLVLQSIDLKTEKAMNAVQISKNIRKYVYIAQLWIKYRHKLEKSDRNTTNPIPRSYL